MGGWASIIIFANIMFCRQRDLFNILKAYAIYDPETGYCQVRMKVIKFKIIISIL